MNELKKERFDSNATMTDIISKLRRDWENGDWKPARASMNWGGADLCIEPKSIGSCNDLVVVVSRYSLELSSLVEELRDRLSGFLDYMNKYAFYPRIGMALNRCIETKGDELDDLIEAALCGVAAIAAEWENEGDESEISLEYLFEKAIGFAANAHHGTCRKGTDIPYILHPMEAAAIVGSMTSDPCLLAAAVLHDVVEDTHITLETIRRKFGDCVAELVAAESETKRYDDCTPVNWTQRKQNTLDRLSTASTEAKMVALGDKLANIRAIKRDYSILGDKLWERFSVKDSAMHGWYYGSLADGLSELCAYPAWQEYKQLVNEVFGKC